MGQRKSPPSLTGRQTEKLLALLEARFEENKARHKNLSWAEVKKQLLAAPEKLGALQEMERTGGEPDIIGRDKEGRLIFFDCAPESPKDRRSLCYDDEAWQARKSARPAGSAAAMAAAMGVELLDEEDYRRLQKCGAFDLKSSSWLQTPAAIRDKGGALFGDRRYDHVFIYHNSAQSYYAARGFRGKLKI